MRIFQPCLITGAQIFWLVVDLPLWKMMEFVSWGYDIPSIWKDMESHKIPWFQTTNQKFYIAGWCWLYIRFNPMNIPVYNPSLFPMIVGFRYPQANIALWWTNIGTAFAAHGIDFSSTSLMPDEFCSALLSQDCEKLQWLESEILYWIRFNNQSVHSPSWTSSTHVAILHCGLLWRICSSIKTANHPTSTGPTHQIISTRPPVLPSNIMEPPDSRNSDLINTY